MSLKLNTGTCYHLKRNGMLGVKTQWGRDLLVVVLNVTKDKRMQKWHQVAWKEEEIKSFHFFPVEEQASNTEFSVKSCMVKSWGSSLSFGPGSKELQSGQLTPLPSLPQNWTACKKVFVYIKWLTIKKMRCQSKTTNWSSSSLERQILRLLTEKRN